MNPSKIRITGPLAPYLSGLWLYLHALGYTPLSARNLARVMSHLSRWLKRQKLEPNALNDQTIEQFLQHRRRLGYQHFLSRRGIDRIIDYLREISIVLPERVAERALCELDTFLEAYNEYLSRERALTPGTINWYRRVAREFLGTYADVSQLDSLTAKDLSSFVLKAVRKSSRGTANLRVSALRAILRYLFLRGYIAIDLAKSVPWAAGSRLTSLPKALTPEAVKSLLRSCDRRTHGGRRSIAAILLMVRLGLRAGEVRALELDDINWRQGEILIRGKGRSVERLPLPEDVGQALASYIRLSRPSASTRKVFLRLRAPHRSLSQSGMGAIVHSACLRAGIAPIGTHRLRHTAATQMLRHGASLSEIAQVLRHRSVDTTAIYAKVDHAALRILVQPWPGGVK